MTEADSHQRRANQRDLGAYKAAVRELLRQISRRNRRLSGLEADLDRLRTLAQELEKTKVDLARSETIFTTLQADKTSLERNLAETSTELTNTRTELAKTSTELTNTRTELAAIKGSVGYRFMRLYGSNIDRLCPEGTRRAELRRLFVVSLRILAEEGTRSYLRHAFRKITRREFRIAGVVPATRKVGKDALEFYLEQDTFASENEKRRRREILRFNAIPKISIIMPTYNSDARFLQEAVESVRQQLYENWELCICDDCSEHYVWDLLTTFKQKDDRIKLARLAKNSGVAEASNEALRLAQGEMIVFLDHDDILSKDALFEVVRSVNADSNIDLLYSDEDKITEKGDHYDPFFKPDWSSELLRSVPYLGHLWVIRKSLLDEIGGFDKRFDISPDYYLQLNAAMKARRIAHIPRILYSWRTSHTSASNLKNRSKFELCCKENLAELKQFARTMNLGEAETWIHPNTFRIKYHLTEMPLVTIVIPTFDKVALFKQCLSSIEKSSYSRKEIIVVTNNVDESSEMRTYLRTLPHKVIVFNGEFCWSEMNNTAAKEAAGKYLIFLNDDTQVLTGDWIENMLRYAQQHDVGAVGSRLLFPDGSCQHAGVTADPIYVAYHQFYGTRGEGYYSMIVLPREVSAVTGACMMVRKEVFDRLGGFQPDLKHLYGDTDFCWRLTDSGYRVVYDPSTVLRHHEGASRYSRIDSEIVAHDTLVMLRKWRKKLLAGDPFHNHHLLNTRIENYGFARSFHPALQSTDGSNSILLVSHNLNLEGAPLGLFNIAKYLKNKGNLIVVISTQDGKLRSDYTRHGIPVIVTPDLPHLCSTQNDALKMFMGSFDIVITNTILMYFTIPFVNASAPWHKPKTVWIIRESQDPRSVCDELGISNETLASALEGTDKVVFVSGPTKDVFKGFYNLRNSVVIHDGIDSPDPMKVSECSDSLMDSGCFKILNVATIYRGKGQDILVDAAIRLLTEFRLNCKFYIVGEIGRMEYYEHLKHKVEKSGLGNRIIFMGELERDDVLSCYSQCDLFVLPSRRDSFPMTVLEAMAFGKPIVATRVFGVTEQIEDGVSGLTIQNEDTEGLVDCILRIYRDPQLAASLGTQARQQFLQEFELERMGNQYVQLVEDLTSHSQRTGRDDA